MPKNHEHYFISTFDWSNWNGIYRLYVYIYMLYNIYVDITSNRHKGSTYRIERCINVAVWTIGQGRLLEINLNVIGRWGGGATPLRFRGIQQHFKRGNGMQLGCLLVHFAWNIIFVIVIVCGFFGGCSIKMQCFHCIHRCVCVVVVVCLFYYIWLVCVVVEVVVVFVVE